MTTKEHLEFCKKCLNRKFNSKQGLICNVTGRIADFEKTCENFKLDESVKEEVNETLIVSNEEIINELDTNKISKLRIHQDFYYAIIGGSLATLISAFIWAVVTVATNYQIGYMAIGVGLLVGFSVQFFGAGIDKKFGYLGAILSLLGCLLGNLFSQVGFITQEQSLGYFETLTYLNLGLIINILVESFSPIDLLFYGIAVYEGYKFAFRKVSVQEIKNLQSEKYEGYPSNYKLRMPLVIVSIVLIGLFLLQISKGVTGFKTFKYELGNRMSEGEMKKSKEHGKWTYWYENGETQLICFYSDGLPDSLWQWFDESGNLLRIGNYKKGIEHGVWINYYKNGIVSDSGSYYESRMNGEWKYRFENGKIYQIGYFKRNFQDSIWKTYYENGQLSSLGEMENSNPLGLWTTYNVNGQLSSKINYLSNNKSYIEDVWDIEGNHIVINGNGLFKSFSNTGQVLLQGNIKDGDKVGKWISYFDNGDIKEEGSYKSEIYKIINSWNSKGEQTVKNGQGLYKSYFPDKEAILETGKIEKGLKEGIWKTYYESTGSLYLENNYIKGKLSGIQKYYFESGQLYSSGEMQDGLREGEWIWYYESGNISSTANLINDKKEGKQIIWSETGEKTKEEIYKNGELIEEKIL
jgi:antitoxin component YwqK of YwqJK toxin-antitoxin module